MLKFSVYVLLLILCLFFGFNNSAEVQLVIFPSSLEFDTKLYYIVFIFFLMGYIVSYLFYGTKSIHLKLSLRTLRKKISFLEKQLEKDDVNDTPLITNDKS